MQRALERLAPLIVVIGVVVWIASLRMQEEAKRATATPDPLESCLYIDVDASGNVGTRYPIDSSSPLANYLIVSYPQTTALDPGPQSRDCVSDCVLHPTREMPEARPTGRHEPV